ncbi:aldehyde dehydrogenase family protein [Bacteroidota bacterium]|nr:aldehyde dehydrogenase family protein [Bacteroidota bacterium]
MAERINVLKTYKIFIGGKFPRTESGRFYQLNNRSKAIANVCLSSRKDLRNAVVAARGAFEKWSGSTAYNRSQILYRMAEMMEGRKDQFISELVLQGVDIKEATVEVDLSIDRVIYFAGWADKINQVFGSVNPVATSHFNFSLMEPMGVVGLVAPEKSGLLGLVSSLCPILVSGNCAVVLASEKLPLCSITLAEVLATSDVPGGVVNILTGKKEEIMVHLAKHMDVNAIYLTDNLEHKKSVQEEAIQNLKRVVLGNQKSWDDRTVENPYIITDFMETKTTWHPVEVISGTGSGY